MEEQQSGKPVASGPESQESPGSGPASAPAPRAAEGGGVAESSITATHSCKPVERILRWGVDSLYLSFHGKLTEETEKRLQELKVKAQSADPQTQSEAQWVIGEHAFLVSDKGTRMHAFILEDGCFRFALARRTASKVPYAYIKLSSRYLSTVTPQEGMETALAILREISEVEGEANVGRIDLFVDFVSFEDMESWRRDAWVTRAHDIDTYSSQQRFTGWSIGKGGPMMARLYDKNLQIEKVGAQYLRTLWDAGGWKDGQPVWRLEFEFKREILTSLGLGAFQATMEHRNGLWSYAMVDWLRLCLPSPTDATRARWPVHPLWAALSSLDFGTKEMPRLRRVVSTSKPKEEAVLRRAVACVITFMALRGISEYLQAIGEMQKGIENILETDATFEGVEAGRMIREKVALREREYFIENGQAVQPEAIEADDRAQAAVDYRKASRGG